MANDQKENSQVRTQTKALNKTQVWKEVEKLIKKHKLPKEASEELRELLAPKAGGGSSQHPPKLDKKTGEIVEAWCKYHQTYEPIDNMVVSNGKPKSYCKAAASKSNKLRKQSKDMDKEVITLMAESKFEEAQEKAKEAKKLSENLNNPELYNLEEDWSEFNGDTKAKDKDK